MTKIRDLLRELKERLASGEVDEAARLPVSAKPSRSHAQWLWGAGLLAVVVVVWMVAGLGNDKTTAGKLSPTSQVKESTANPGYPTHSSPEPRQAEADPKRRESAARVEPSGTVRDPKTGLLWTKRDNGSDVNWNDAKRYCDNLTLGGYSDWRMGTIDELEALYEEGSGSNNVRLGIELSYWWSWSSTMKGPSLAWYFYFVSGHRYGDDLSFGFTYRVLCVRRPGA